MAYPTLALHLLISAPGDVPLDDMTAIRKTISQWNLNLGRHVGLTVLPVSWTEHAVAEFGERPQAILNHQIVEEADLAVALFHDRLGTPTGEAESGTAEEINVLVEAGTSVAVLVNSAPRPPLNGAALDERQRLNAYLTELRKSASSSSTRTREFWSASSTTSSAERRQSSSSLSKPQRTRRRRAQILLREFGHAPRCARA